MIARFGFILVTAGLLTGCATTHEEVNSGGNHYEEVDVSKIKDPVPKHEPKSKYGNPSSYQVFGKTYYVKNSTNGFKERGHASWYGHPFHGRRTSSGEEYDMYKMTAAHKTVPIPCYMRVTNLKTGKSIVVRVNDRGPFHDGRVIDLSYVAAKKLGVHAHGIVPVEIEVITPDYDPREKNIHTASAPSQQRRLSLTPPTENATHTTSVTISSAPVTSSTQGIYLQVAAFNDRTRAQQVASHLQQQLGTDAKSHVTDGYSNNQPVFRVRVGPFPDHGQAQQYMLHITRIYPDTQPFVVK